MIDFGNKESAFTYLKQQCQIQQQCQMKQQAQLIQQSELIQQFQLPLVKIFLQLAEVTSPWLCYRRQF